MKQQSKLSASRGTGAASPINACAAETKAPCAQSVENIRDLLDRLRGSIAGAEAKFAPALCTSPNPDEGKPMPAAHSELHGALLDFEDQLRRVIVSVDVLADRSTL